MKKLTLIRHAKSSWKEPDMSDFERPLNKRGLEDLPGLVERTTQQLPRPDLLIFSGAERTRLTQKPLSEAWKLSDREVLERHEAYEASVQTLLQLLQQQPDSCEHLVLVGHNPGMSDLLSLLNAQPAQDFPTSAFAHLELAISSWNEVIPACGDLLIFDYPKLHA